MKRPYEHPAIDLIQVRPQCLSNESITPAGGETDWVRILVVDEDPC